MYKLIHISEVKAGDVVVINGEEKTVTNSNIKRCPFMGLTLFGYNYKFGRELVTIRPFEYMLLDEDNNVAYKGRNREQAFTLWNQLKKNQPCQLSCDGKVLA